MAKYLRIVEDGDKDYIMEYYEFHSYCADLQDGGLEFEGGIVASSDNLQDLFDEVVLVNPYRFKKPKTSTELEKDFDEMKDFYTTEEDQLFGAIWTAAGLVFASKLNKERDWELGF